MSGKSDKDVHNGISFDMTKSILINGYSSQDLINMFYEFTFLSDDEKQLILSKLALFIGLSDEGNRIERVIKSNIAYISDKIGQESLD
ncbi:MAG TPA: hypothetical protein VKN14_02420 [Flavobacteriaceae bacterium]|nr:hypothetical protein [Flavobacteriaceae bacterium]